jgi:hypothetical protein
MYTKEKRIMKHQTSARKPLHVSEDALKIVAAILLCLQTFSVCIIEYGMIHIDTYTEETLSAALSENAQLTSLVGWGSGLQLIGCISLPLFALFLVEGFHKTSDLRRYVLSMVLLAVVSEIPYDLAINRTIGDMSSQNPMIGMCICLIMMYFMQALKEKGGVTSFLQIPVAAIAIIMSILLGVQYGLILVFLVIVLYVFRDRKVMKIVLGVFASLTYVTMPFGFWGVAFYGGERKNILPKYVYYILYPAQYLIFWAISRFVLGAA